MPGQNSILEVEIRRSGNGFSIQTNDGQSSSGEKPFSLDLPTEIEGKIKEVHERAAGMGDWDRDQDREPHDEVCRAIGEYLFGALFKDKTVAQHYRGYMAAQPDDFKPRLVLRMDRDFYSLPWELLVDPEDDAKRFLAIRGSVSRSDIELVKSDATMFTPSSKLSWVYFVCSPKVENVFSPIAFASDSVPELPRTTLLSYKEKIETDPRPDGFILHGHGDVHPPDAPKYGRFHFLDDKQEPDPIDAVAVAQELKSAQRTAVVLSCDSAWISNDQLRFERTFAGGLFVKSELDFVIGMQRDMHVVAADEFVREFVRYLITQQKPLDYAVTEGRKAVRRLQVEKQLQPPLNWWIPAVYTKTSSFKILRNPEDLPPTIPRRPITPSAPLDALERKPVPEGVVQRGWHWVKGVVGEFSRRLVS